jgi:hypothetical protein
MLNGTSPQLTLNTPPEFATQEGQSPDPSPPEQQPHEEQVAPDRDGTEFVDIPPELKPRFNRIYHNLKEFERDNGALRQHIAQLTEVVNGMQTGQAQAQEQVQRQRILQQIVQAKEAGNIAEEVRLQGELATVGQRVTKPVTLPPPPPGQSADIAVVEQWSREVAGDGNFRRPWALEGHPRYSEAYNLVASLVSDARYAGNTDAILAEVDRRMGLQGNGTRPPGATVLSGGQVRPQVEAEVQLSPDELNMARKFGISPKDYALQQKLIGQGNRAYSRPTITPRSK